MKNWKRMTIDQQVFLVIFLWKTAVVKFSRTIPQQLMTALLHLSMILGLVNLVLIIVVNLRLIIVVKQSLTRIWS